MIKNRCKSIENKKFSQFISIFRQDKQETMKAIQSVQGLQLNQFKPTQAQTTQAEQFSGKRLQTLQSFVKNPSNKEYLMGQQIFLTQQIEWLKRKQELFQNEISINRSFFKQLSKDLVQTQQDLQSKKFQQPELYLDELKQKIVDTKLKIVQLNKNRVQEAASLNVSEFTKISLKNKDVDNQLHELFQWILQIFYKESISQYNWPNFREEVFVNDKGEDLKERLGKVKAINMKGDEVEKTKYILNLRDRLYALMNDEVRQQAKGLMRIAQYMLETNDLSKDIVNLENDVYKQQHDIKHKNTVPDKLEQKIESITSQIVFLEKNFIAIQRGFDIVSNLLNAAQQNLERNRQIIQILFKYIKIYYTKSGRVFLRSLQLYFYSILLIILMSTVKLEHIQLRDLQIVDHKIHNSQDAMKFSSNRINTIEKFVKDSLNQDRQYFTQERETLTNINQILHNYIQQLNEKIKLNQEEQANMIEDLKVCQQENTELRQQTPKKTESQIQEEIKEFKSQIKKLNQMRLTEATSLNPAEIAKLVMKNKDQESPVNEVFLWILQVIYKEAASNYYWNNFKEQVFEKDKGEDIKKRLGLIKAVDMKKDEIDKTASLLKLKDKIMGSPLLNANLKVQFEIIFKIIDLIMQTEECGIRVHEKEKEIIKILNEKSKIEQDLNRNENKLKAIHDRIEFLRKLNQEFDRIKTVFALKTTSYVKAQVMNDKVVDELEKSYVQLDFSKSYQQQDVGTLKSSFEHQQYLTVQQYEQTHQQQETPEEQQQFNQTEQEQVEEVRAQQEEEIQFEKPPPTEISQTNKGGGCEACKIF
ncbi:hypothetical protein pb186bvf_007095 [Paramecium bursaria]